MLDYLLALLAAIIGASIIIWLVYVLLPITVLYG